MLGQRLKRVAEAALNLTVYPLSRWSLRRNDQWVFGHQDDLFAGNPKYLYLWMCIHRSDIRVTWITRSRKTQAWLAQNGFSAHLRWSVKGIRAVLRAGVIVYAHSAADVNLTLSNGALLVNLWHGVGIKATMLGDAHGVVARHRHHRKHLLTRALYLGHVTFPDIVVTTSDFMQEHFSSQFELPKANCPQLGYPRLDILSCDTLRETVLALERTDGPLFPASCFDELILYAPTFRDSGRAFLREALPDLEVLERTLAARNAVLYVKLHPRTEESVPDNFHHIKLWPSGADLYAHLFKFDVLITDYSSILYDYIFSNRGYVILYTYDYMEYLSSDRSLLYDFDAHVAGAQAKNFRTLCDLIALGPKAMTAGRHKIDALRALFWSGSPNCASAGIVEHVLSLRPLARPQPTS